MKLSTYSLFLGTTLVTSVEGVKRAYDVWAQIRDLAEACGKRALLVYDEDAEILAAYEPGEGGDPFDDNINDYTGI